VKQIITDALTLIAALTCIFQQKEIYFPIYTTTTTTTSNNPLSKLTEECCQKKNHKTNPKSLMVQPRSVPLRKQLIPSGSLALPQI